MINQYLASSIIAVKKFSSLLSVSLLLNAPLAKGSETTQQNMLMPPEYSKIKNLVSRIQRYNDLRNFPLTFTVVSGEYGAWLAEELRLCKENECSYYENLNPFGLMSRREKEIIRQSYIYSDIQGTAYSNGTITIPQSTFRVLQGKDNFLACLLAHEISHIINHDSYEESHASVEGGFTSDSEEDKLKRAELAQQNELNADKNAIIMVANSGFPKHSCRNFLVYLSKSKGFATNEDKYGTHPSSKQRFIHAENITNTYTFPKKTIDSTPRSWSYDNQNNYLFLAPN